MVKGWLSIEGAAEYASVSKRTVKGWLQEGLSHCRVSHKTILVRPQDIDTFIEAYRVEDSQKQVESIVNDVLRGLEKAA